MPSAGNGGSDDGSPSVTNGDVSPPVSESDGRGNGNNPSAVTDGSGERGGEQDGIRPPSDSASNSQQRSQGSPPSEERKSDEEDGDQYTSDFAEEFKYQVLNIIETRNKLWELTNLIGKYDNQYKEICVLHENNAELSEKQIDFYRTMNKFAYSKEVMYRPNPHVNSTMACIMMAMDRGMVFAVSDESFMRACCEGFRKDPPEPLNAYAFINKLVPAAHLLSRYQHAEAKFQYLHLQLAFHLLMRVHFEQRDDLILYNICTPLTKKVALTLGKFHVQENGNTIMKDVGKSITESPPTCKDLIRYIEKAVEYKKWREQMMREQQRSIKGFLTHDDVLAVHSNFTKEQYQERFNVTPNKETEANEGVIEWSKEYEDVAATCLKLKVLQMHIELDKRFSIMTDSVFVRGLQQMYEKQSDGNEHYKNQLRSLIKVCRNASTGHNEQGDDSFCDDGDDNISEKDKKTKKS